MNCRAFRRNLLAYVDGILRPDATEAMRAHAAECASCGRHDIRVRRALMVARSLRPIEPSPGFTERLEARLRAVRQQDAGGGLDPMSAPRGPGLVEFLGTAVGLVAAGLLAVAVLERFQPAQALSLPPVMAAAPAEQELPFTSPAFVASASPGLAIWSAALMLDQARVHFANADLPANAR